MASPHQPRGVSAHASVTGEEDLVMLQDTTEISADEMEEMLTLFSTSTFRHPTSTVSSSKSVLVHTIQDRCLHLFKLDYHVSLVSNRDGRLCPNYPLDIIILERERRSAHEGASECVKEKESVRPSSDQREETQQGVDHTRASEESTASSTAGETHKEVDGSHDEPHLDDKKDEGLDVKEEDGDDEGLSANDASTLEPLFEECKFARTRCRFAVPVILLGRQNICRSSTLARSVEAVMRTLSSGLSDFMQGRGIRPNGGRTSAEMSMTQSIIETFDEEHISQIRQADTNLLKALRVRSIIDLMVEDRKVKYGLVVTSSEKVEREEGLYEDFHIVQAPYPGCEWFTCFKNKRHITKDFDLAWSEERHVNVEVSLPRMDIVSNSVHESLLANFSQYKTWDLITLTQNYLKLLLLYLRSAEEKGDDCAGLLIHCISGWDRTPLFISLLRLSLWADGKIHQSLTPQQMLYLTIGYDWLLFGHQLPSRIHKGEEIFLFCFYFLQFMASEEYSLYPPHSPPHSPPPAPVPAPVPAPPSSSTSPTAATAPCSSSATTFSPSSPPLSSSLSSNTLHLEAERERERESPRMSPRIARNISSTRSPRESREHIMTSTPSSSSLDDKASHTAAIPATSWRSQAPDEPSAGSWQMVSNLSLSLQSIPDGLQESRERSSSILSETSFSRVGDAGRASTPSSLSIHSKLDVDVEPTSTSALDIEEALREAALCTDEISGTSPSTSGESVNPTKTSDPASSSSQKQASSTASSSNPFWTYQSPGPETERARKLRELQAICIPMYQKVVGGGEVNTHKGLLDWLGKLMPWSAGNCTMTTTHTEG